MSGPGEAPPEKTPPRSAPDTRRPRTGPRPLALHLATVASALLSSSAALPHLRNGSLPWKPHLRDRAEELCRQIARTDADALAGAVDRAVRRQLDLALTGIERYRRHPYRRDLPDPPVLWAEGASRLLDYGALGRGRGVVFRGGGGGGGWGGGARWVRGPARRCCSCRRWSTAITYWICRSAKA